MPRLSRTLNPKSRSKRAASSGGKGAAPVRTERTLEMSAPSSATAASAASAVGTPEIRVERCLATSFQ
jgi:hypothetical protein